MRTVCWMVLLALMCQSAQAADAPGAIYDRDPASLWNRLYRAVAVRSAAGVAYGLDNSEPYVEPFDDRVVLVRLLDEFLRHHGEALSADPMKRALLQNDLWTAFDLAAYGTGGDQGAVVDRGVALRARLAQVIERLSLSQTQIAALPDNYAEAVRSGRFPAEFDPEHPVQAFLPPDLFDPRGPWVQIGSPRNTPLAAVHIAALSGRSWFAVYIRCPGGRQATLDYLQALNLHRTPWVQSPGALGAGRAGVLRLNPLLPDPRTPQFPAGTMVALVRRMMVIDDGLNLVPTAVTQGMELRVYVRAPAPGRIGAQLSNFLERQRVFKIAMRRRELLAGRSGGLQAVIPGEREYQFLSQPMGVPRATYLQGPVVLETCAVCHLGEGIFSVDVYYQNFVPEHPSNPQLPPMSSQLQSAEGEAATWKGGQFNWGLLEGLLEGQRLAASPP